MKNTSKPNRCNTEESILAAAEEEFMLKGYAGARTTAIAEKAGVTHAMLHYYFRTKDKLYDKIIESKIGTIRDIMLGSVGDSSLPLFKKLKMAIEHHFDFIAANPELPRFMISEVFNNPQKLPVVLEILKNNTPLIVESLQRQIDEYVDRGLCRKVDTVMLILDIVSLNIFSFMAMPITNTLFKDVMSDREAFLKRRKQENIETIMRKLKP